MAKDIQGFIKFAQKQLKLQKSNIELKGHAQDSKHAFGSYKPKENEIDVRDRGRQPLDVMRTIAHELTHQKQHEKGTTGGGKAGSKGEDEANAKAGEIMRKYDDTHPKEFKKAAFKEEGEGSVPTNSMGTSSSTAGTGGIDTYDPLLKIRKILKRKAPV